MIKLIALDLDGTLLKDNHTIDMETLEFLKNLKDTSYFIATGRCYSFVEDIIKNYDLDCDLLLNNGHEFISKDKKVRWDYPLKKDVLKEIVSILLKYSCEFMMYDSNGKKYTFTPLEKLYDNHIEFIELHYGENIDHLLDKPLFSKESYLRDTVLLDNIDDLDELNILKIDIRAISEDLSSKTLAELNSIENLSITSSYHNLIEVCDDYMSKGSMVKKIAELYNVTLDEVASFGDGSNDIEMLDMVKYSFAMGNASDKVKKYAKFVTDTNGNQGILKGLKRLLDDKLIS